jgi:hypothetical protein
MSGPGRCFVREISGKRAVLGLPLQSAPTAELAVLFGGLREWPGSWGERPSRWDFRRARIAGAASPRVEEAGKRSEAAQVCESGTFLMGVCGMAVLFALDLAGSAGQRRQGRVRTAETGGYN